MAGKQKAAKNPTKKEKQALANQDMQACLKVGASATPIVAAGHCPTASSPEQSETEDKSAQDKMHDNVKKLHKRIKNLEHQVTMAFEHSQWACPMEIIQSLGRKPLHAGFDLGLAKIEDSHGRFRNNPRITIGEAINIQDAFAEILMVCFNNSAAVLYKVRLSHVILDEPVEFAIIINHKSMIFQICK